MKYLLFLLFPVFAQGQIIKGDGTPLSNRTFYLTDSSIIRTGNIVVDLQGYGPLLSMIYIGDAVYRIHRRKKHIWLTREIPIK